MTDPFRPPRAVVTDSQVATAPSVARKGISVWILIPIVLVLDLFMTTQVIPILHQLVFQSLVVLLDSSSRFLFNALIPSFVPGFIVIGLTITLVFQVVLIYGAWLLSRARRLSTVVIIGILLTLEAVALQWWVADQRLTFAWELALPLFTAMAAAIAYGWARTTARNSTVG